MASISSVHMPLVCHAVPLLSHPFLPARVHCLLCSGLHGDAASASELSAARSALLLRALNGDQEFLEALQKVQLITEVDHRTTVLKVRQSCAANAVPWLSRT
jgi:hypothetical protein